MKKILLLLVVVFAVFVFVERQKLYLRDPFAGVVRDGVKMDGVQVYINASNDVMMMRTDAPAFWTVVQHENHVGTPRTMKGMMWVVYLADEDVVPLLVVDANAVVDSMTGKAVAYHEGKHVTVVSLR